MKFRKLILVTSLVLALAMSLSGTIAYLSDTDEDVNVMVLGNVEIEQIEQERVNEKELPTVAGNLKAYTQAKPLYPAYFSGTSIPWNRASEDEQAWKVVESGHGALDKFVTVKNTGKSDAYVRTLIAYEGDATYGPEGAWIHVVHNADNVTPAIDINLVAAGIKIGESTYTVYEYVYTAALKPGETTVPSLKQVYMNNMATNDVVKNYGSTYDILVISQAVQTVNMPNDPKQALDAAFGNPEEKAAEWFGSTKIPVVVYSVDEMREAMKTPGVKIILGEDIEIDDDKGTGYCLYAKYDCEIDLNGHNIEVSLPGKVFNGVIYALNGAKVNIVGEGDININGGIGPFIWCTGANGDTAVNIYGGNWTQDSADFASDYCEGLYANREGVINIYGGVFSWENFEEYTVNESREGVVNVYGGTFINFDPSVSHDSDGSYVAEGYKVVSETKDNGDVWYTVVSE